MPRPSRVVLRIPDPWRARPPWPPDPHTTASAAWPLCPCRASRGVPPSHDVEAAHAVVPCLGCRGIPSALCGGATAGGSEGGCRRVLGVALPLPLSQCLGQGTRLRLSVGRPDGSCGRRFLCLFVCGLVCRGWWLGSCGREAFVSVCGAARRLAGRFQREWGSPCERMLFVLRKRRGAC